MFGNILKKAKDTASKATETASKATEAASKVTETASKATEAASKVTETASKASDELILNLDLKKEIYSEIIETTIVDVALPILIEKLVEDEELTELLMTAYEVLPLVVRIAVTRDMFIKYCLSQKEPLLEKIKLEKEKRRK